MRLSLLAVLGSLTCATTSLAGCGQRSRGRRGRSHRHLEGRRPGHPGHPGHARAPPGPARRGSLYVTDDQSGAVYRITP